MKKKTFKAEDIYPEVKSSNYFATRKGSFWGWRIICDLELILIIAGDFLYQTEDNTTEVKGGDVLIIPPGVNHILKCVELSAGHAAIACIHTEPVKGRCFLDGDYKLTPEPLLITKTARDPAIHTLFRNCRDTFEGFGIYREQILSSIVKEIWLRLAQLWRTPDSKKLSSRMDKITTFIRRNIDRKLSRSDLATEFNLSPEYLNRIFKEETGVTPVEYINHVKIYRAYRYLTEEGFSVKEVASLTGFSDEFYFSKVFKRIIKVSPASVRIK